MKITFAKIAIFVAVGLSAIVGWFVWESNQDKQHSPAVTQKVVRIDALHTQSGSGEILEAIVRLNGLDHTIRASEIIGLATDGRLPFNCEFLLRKQDASGQVTYSPIVHKDKTEKMYLYEIFRVQEDAFSADAKIDKVIKELEKLGGGTI